MSLTQIEPPPPEAIEAPPVAAPAPAAPMGPTGSHPVLAPVALAAFVVLAALAFAWIVDGSPPRP